MTATHSSVSRSAESEPQAHELESYHERYSAESAACVAIFARPLRSPETLRRPSQYRTLFQSSKSHPRTDLTELEIVFASLPKRYRPHAFTSTSAVTRGDSADWPASFFVDT